MEKVSIIVPIYNSEKFLKKCLDSLINQTYKNIEIVCVNDGSKDNSLEILKDYKSKDNRVVVIDKENEGVSIARNTGIQKATGEYITFVDSDDWVDEDFIEKLYTALKEQNVEVVRGNFYKNSNYETHDFVGNLKDLKNKTFFTTEKKFSNSVINKIATGELPCYVVLLMASKENILKTPLFNSELKLMEDVVFYMNLLNNVESIYFLDTPIYHYYENKDSCTLAEENYIRNMYNVGRVNFYIKDILKESKFDKECIDIFNTYHSNLISNFVFNIYKIKKDKKFLKECIDKLLANEEMNGVLMAAKVKSLPIHLRYSINYLRNKKYIRLFIIYKLRIILNKIKSSK